MTSSKTGNSNLDLPRVYVWWKRGLRRGAGVIAVNVVYIVKRRGGYSVTAGEPWIT